MHGKLHFDASQRIGVVSAAETAWPADAWQLQKK